jgi:hypothetical protein
MIARLRQQKLCFAVSLAILAIINLRLFWLPGLNFSSKIWDDEKAWLDQYQASTIIDFVLQRDGAGYYVFVPKILFALAQLIPSFAQIDTLRFSIILIQLTCYAIAASCVFMIKYQKYSWLVLFSALSSTYIEDLNYMHNVGYLFIFPIYFLTFKRINDGDSVPFSNIFLAAFLICKPFTGVLTIVLAIFYLRKKSINLKLFILTGYSIVYLILYLVLPHDYETPFNTNLSNLFYVIVDLPWILFTALIPAFYIGVFGLVNLLNASDLRLVLGVVTNLLQFFIIIKFRKQISKNFLGLSFKSKSFLLILFMNYLMVFSAYDSFWVKNFPLYNFDSPNFIWARWSAVIPLISLLFIASLEAFSLRIRLQVLAFIGAQWLLLTILGQQYLVRFW